MTSLFQLSTWLSKKLPKGSRVGVDPKLISYKEWIPLKARLNSTGQELVPVNQNLIDLIWRNQPPQPNKPIVPLARKYTGKSIKEKLVDINKHMKKMKASALVVTSLDEIAWFLNLRGSDIKYNPVFFAYLVILPERFVFFVTHERYTLEVEQHLREEAAGVPYTIKPYSSIGNYVKELADTGNTPVWFSENTNYYLISLLHEEDVIRTSLTPISLMKVIKNHQEGEGMRRAHVKDAVAVISYFAWLEEQIKSGNTVTEISGAEKLEEFRKKQENYIGPSFTTISAVGPHGAIIHYHATEDSDVPINANELYLCDSGGQYLDGTTDITRTLHFGEPTEYEKIMYTLVLKGQINLYKMTFPRHLRGNFLDSFARKFLWCAGLEYRHGTGHGIGSYLNVHEGPSAIAQRSMPADPGIQEGMFFSNEPGYYEDGKFGIRIEDIMQVVPATTTYSFQDMKFCTFEAFTLVPKQLKLIQTDMLTQFEIDFINAYHQKCRDVIGPLLDCEAKKWLWKETVPIFKCH